MAYKNTDYSTSMRGDVTPIKSVMYRTENNIVRPYFMRKVEESGPDYSEPFYVEDISGSDNTVTIKKSNASAPTPIIYSSLDGKSWTSMGSTSTTGITATVPANGKLYLRGSTGAWGNSSHYNSIRCSEKYNIGGNIMSLLYGSSFTGEETTFPSGSTYTFKFLFDNSKKLVSAEKLLLPATTLTQRCYSALFYGCSSLTTAPELPATTLAQNCYQSLFYECSSLTTAPVLPATTLAQNCYQSLFYGCTSLNYIKVGFTAWPNMSSGIDRSATFDWTGLTKNTTGTFVCPAALPQYFNASGNTSYSSSTLSGYTNTIPYGWTVETY